MGQKFDGCLIAAQSGHFPSYIIFQLLTVVGMVYGSISDMFWWKFDGFYQLFVSLSNS